MFRRRRLTDEQLLSIFRSLPQAKAPADTEERLGRLIAQHSDHVPSVLGSLPWISAPADFDERLMEAIRDSRRPVAPIPPSPVVGGPSSGWFTNIPGWVGGVIAAAGLLFFLNHSGDMVEAEGASHATPVPASAGPAPKKASIETLDVSDQAPSISQADAQSRTAPAPVVRESVPVTGAERFDINPAPARHQRASAGTPTELSIPAATPTASITPAGIPAVDDSDGGLATPAKATVPQIPTSQPESLGHAYPTRIDSASEQPAAGAESGPNKNIIVDTGGGRKSQDSTRKNP
ncbi:MAG: hypothetical protein ABI876_13655 [Bacteroidota bacterium]